MISLLLTSVYSPRFASAGMLAAPPAGTSYLSDLTWSSINNGWGPVERDRSNGEFAQGDGRPITLNSIVYNKGLGAHAASDVRYDLGGLCSVFEAQVGVDDEVGANGSVAFQVYGDTTLLFNSGTMTGNSATQNVNVNVTGRTTLRLVITDGGNGVAADHGDWALARVTCGSAPTPTPAPPLEPDTQYLSDRQWATMSNGWGPVERDRSNGESVQGDGNPITLNGQAYGKGLGAHAFSDLRYSLGGTCTAFIAKVGVDDEVGANGSVAFRVYGDSVLLFDSGTMTGNSATQNVNVNVTGRTTLQLVVTDGGNGVAADHGDWALARVTCPTPPTPTNTSSPTSTSTTTPTLRPTETPTSTNTPTVTLTPTPTNTNSPTVTPTLEPDAQYLSDRTWSSMSNGWGPVELDRSNGDFAQGDGNPITLNGQAYGKGLGAHAASDVRYNLGGACSAFLAKVGVDDEVGANGSVAFEVYGDNNLLFSSGVMTATSATQNVNVNVTGRTTLRLVVTDGGDGAGADHGDWALARVTCPTPPTATNSPTATNTSTPTNTAPPTATPTLEPGTQYLSDRQWSAMYNGWGPVELDRSNGDFAQGDGRPITLNGQVYGKGLGTNAASAVHYILGGACSAFLAKVGVDDEVGANGSVAFEVYGDNNLLFSTGIMTGSSATQDVSVNIAGRNELRLVVTDGGDGAGADHGDWALARVTCQQPPTPGPGTPTSTPTNIPGPSSTVTPAGATLLQVSASPNGAGRGSEVTLSYTIYSPTGGTYFIGASISSAVESFFDLGNDKVVTVPAGTTIVTRRFYFRPDATPGVYTLRAGLWDRCRTVQYNQLQLDNLLTVLSVTATPWSPIATPTSTTVPTPSSQAIVLGVSGPQGGGTLNTGTNTTLSYTLINTGPAMSVRLVARLSPSGQDGYGVLQDTLNASTVNVPTGTSTFTRLFSIPATAGEGSYDLTWEVVNASNNGILSTRTAQDQIWLQAPGAEPVALSLNSVSLTSNSITLQNGVLNRITGVFNVLNEDTTRSRAVLRMRIKRNGTTQWVSDLAGEKLVSIPVGTSSFNLGFAIPRYLPSGSYDVTWEIGDPGLFGTQDNTTLNNALQITNPSVVTNVGVPILMYHSIWPAGAGGNYVPMCDFEAQMDYLVTNGYTTITGNDIYNHIYKGIALPIRPVWLTFDDSYQNAYDYAYPILQSRGLRGSFYSVTQFMEQYSTWIPEGEEIVHHMNWEQLRTMHQSGQAADGHTQRHVALYDLDYPQQKNELWGSQRDMVNFIGIRSENFAYPFGQHPESAKWLLAHSGYRTATVIGQVKQYTNYADLFEMTRIGIAGGDSLDTFVTKLTQP